MSNITNSQGGYETQCMNSINCHYMVRNAKFPCNTSLWNNYHTVDIANMRSRIAIECDDQSNFQDTDLQLKRERDICRYFSQSNEWNLIRLHYRNNSKWNLYLDQIIAIVSCNKDIFKGKIIIDHDEYYRYINLWDLTSSQVIHVRSILNEVSLQGTDPSDMNDDIIMKEDIII